MTKGSEIGLAGQEAVAAAFRAIQKEYGRIDLLVNNAGVAVFAISPGLVRTTMTKDIPEDFAPDAGWTPIEKAAEICAELATGRADVLTGRFIHASEHSLDDLLARADEILAQNLQTMRLAE